MNVKEYIASGIVESYVLGLLPEQERLDFENLCNQYPEISGARIAFEEALAGQLLADAARPPQHLKKQIEERLVTATSDNGDGEQEEETTPVRKMGAWKWLAAASLVLMAGAAWWAFSTNKKYQELQAENNRLKEQMQLSAVQMDTMRLEREMLTRPDIKMAMLKGTAMAPQSYATIYWDTTGSRDVYLLVNNLPEPPTSKQYQLWALADGQPIDLGVVNYEVRQRRLLVKMQNVQKAQAFAITLEPRGGSTAPTLDSMYVMGSL